MIHGSVQCIKANYGLSGGKNGIVEVIRKEFLPVYKVSSVIYKYTIYKKIGSFVYSTKYNLHNYNTYKYHVYNCHFIAP